MLEEFCKQLKEKRKELGYSIEDVVEKTKLYPVAIRDIEDGNLENISPIYLKGFIKIYSSFLGVDSVQALKDVSSVKPKPKPSFFRKVKIDAPLKKEAVAPVPVADKKNYVNSSSSFGKTTPMSPPGEKKEKIPVNLPVPEIKKLAVLLFLAVVLLAGMISFGRFIMKARAGHKHQPVQAEQFVPEGAEPVRKASAREIKRNTRNKIKKSHQSAAQKKHKRENETIAAPMINLPKDFIKTAEMTVSLTARKSCFIRVKSDNKLLFEGILKKGVVESWRGHKIIELKISDGSALYIELNGRPLPVLTAMRKPIKSLKITPVGISVDK